MIALLSATWGEIHQLSKELVPAKEETGEHVRYKTGRLYGQSLVLVETGVGISRARAGVSYIIQKFKPRLIIFAGLSGALDPELNIGDIIVGDYVISLKRSESRELSSPAARLEADYIEGPVLTENRFIHTPELKKKLYLKSRALVVDMETWGAARAAQQSGTPLVCVRSVSDASSDTLPDMGAIYGSSGGLDFTKAFPYFLRNPGMITSYTKFRYMSSKKSTDTLHDFLKILIAGINEIYPGAGGAG